MIFFIALKKPVALTGDSTNGFCLNTPKGPLKFKSLKPGLKTAIEILCAEGTDEETLADLYIQAEGSGSLARFYYNLEQFRKLNLICYPLNQNGRCIATLQPGSPQFNFLKTTINPDAKYVLSRFAYLHSEQETTVLESSLGHAKIQLHDWKAAAVVHQLASPQTLAELQTLNPEFAENTLETLIAFCLSAKAIELADVQNGESVKESLPLQQWEFHDLLFHAKSRLGRHDNGFGGTFRFLNTIDPRPAVKPAMNDDGIDLHKPDLESLMKNDPSFAQVLENRQSIRSYGDAPLDSKRLGEFLYRVARVRSLQDADPSKGVFYPASNRPYPGGGACYELELYPIIHRCEGMEPGLYHYNPLKHQLNLLRPLDSEVECLLKDAQNSYGGETFPDILITVSARFNRVNWKYESLAYSLILKNVGVLYQTMYLAATAMDLASCALGGGDADAFARIAGLDYYAETSVGEFILGSHP